MITAFKRYMHYRKKGFNHQAAWFVSDCDLAAKTLRNWLIAALVCIGVVYLISDKASASENNQEYVKTLEKTLSVCLNEGLNVVWIGDSQYFCGLYATGEKK